MKQNLDIYVKTSPLGKQIGIHWRKIEGEQNREEPELVTKIIVDNADKRNRVFVNDLINPQKPSLLIFRGEEKLLLELAGIECPRLSEKSDRKVLASIVWLAEDSPENEKIIRIIAYEATDNILGKTSYLWEKIEESISFYGAEEFRVNRNIIDDYVTELVESNRQNFRNAQPQQQYIIHKRNEEDLKLLAEELKECNLPQEWIAWNDESKKNGVLVAFTEDRDKKTILYEAGVWRGYADNAIEPEKKLPEPPQLLKPPQPSQTQPKSSKKITPVMIIITAMIVAILLVLFLQKPVL